MFFTLRKKSKNFPLSSSGTRKILILVGVGQIRSQHTKSWTMTTTQELRVFVFCRESWSQAANIQEKFYNHMVYKNKVGEIPQHSEGQVKIQTCLKWHSFIHRCCADSEFSEVSVSNEIPIGWEEGLGLLRVSVL